mmetsp:Transcript_29837/g.45134  ORF Transcript_29837/g.45134 Transcript_29837/m.45134 type:complete len:205 (-) Transcript_29837:574-1188(-)
MCPTTHDMSCYRFAILTADSPIRFRSISFRVKFTNIASAYLYPLILLINYWCPTFSFLTRYARHEMFLVGAVHFIRTWNVVMIRITIRHCLLIGSPLPSSTAIIGNGTICRCYIVKQLFKLICRCNCIISRFWRRILVPCNIRVRRPLTTHYVFLNRWRHRVHRNLRGIQSTCMVPFIPNHYPPFIFVTNGCPLFTIIRIHFIV